MTRACAAIGLLALTAAAAFADTGADPTRPSIDATGGSGASVAQANSGLQSIIRRKGAKPAALINGEYVELGGKVGESRLTAIEDAQVVLTAPDGTRDVMALTPGIEKRVAEKPAPAPVTTHRKRARKTRVQPTSYPTMPAGKE